MDQRATKNALTFSALSAFALLQLSGQEPFSFLVDSVFPFLGTEDNRTTSRDELAAVLTASLTALGVFAASFLASVFLFMCIDLSGVWREYQLQKNRRATWRNYWQGLENFFFDFLFLFAPFNTLLFYLHRDVVVLAPPWTPPPSHSPSLHPFAPQGSPEAAFALALVLGRVVLGFVVGKVWSYFAHFLLHQKWLYRAVHKRHHVSTQDMVASHSWYETVPEFIFMELPNLLMVVALFPVHWSFLCLYYAYHAFSGASDHSGFKVNWLVDSEYHFLHHKQQLVNYGEFEVLDLLFRTHHSLLPKRPAPVLDQPHAESIQTPL